MENVSVVKKKYINYIDKVIKNNKLSHSYLIEISDYENDMKYVLDFVKMILCNISYEELESSTNPIIHQIDHNNYPDVEIFEPDGSFIKKAQMISLQKEFNNKSLLDNKRIYIIKNVDKFNSASANTMLKFIEEPEENIIAILLTENRYSVIETILSRCQILSLKEFNTIRDIDSNLKEIIQYVLNPNNFFIHYSKIINELIVDKNAAREQFLKVEDVIIGFLNHKYSRKSEKNDMINSLFSGIDEKKLIQIISILEEEISKLEMNINYKMWLDCLFSRLTVGG